MRRICWILSLTACALLAQRAMAGAPATGGLGLPAPELPEPRGTEPPSTPGGTQMGTGYVTGTYCPSGDYGRCKCHAAPAYTLAPGCCEHRRHCFDNAWDGYCQERARWDTFWSKVGTRTRHDGRGAASEVQLPTAAGTAAQQWSACVYQKH